MNHRFPVLTLLVSILTSLTLIFAAPAHAETQQQNAAAFILMLLRGGCDSDEELLADSMEDETSEYEEALSRFGTGISIPGGVTTSENALTGCKHIVHIGDSISTGPGLGSRLQAQYRKIDPGMIYLANTGAPLSGWGLQQIKTNSAHDKKHCFIIELGTNDMGQKPGNTLKSNLDAALTAMSGSQILWVTPFATKDTQNVKIANMADFHTILKEKAGTTDGLYLANWFQEADPDKDFDADPVHPNQHGYDHLANIILLSMGAKRGMSRQEKPIRLQTDGHSAIQSPIDGTIEDVGDDYVVIKSSQSGNISMRFTEIRPLDRIKASKGRTIKGGDDIGDPAGKNNTFVVEIQESGKTISFHDWATSGTNNDPAVSVEDDISNDQSNAAVQISRDAAGTGLNHHTGRPGSTQDEKPSGVNIPGVLPPSNEQLDTMKIIYIIGSSMGMSDTAIISALATAEKETQYRNLFHNGHPNLTPMYGCPEGCIAKSGTPLDESARQKFRAIQPRLSKDLGIWDENNSDGNSIGIMQQQINLNNRGIPTPAKDYKPGENNGVTWGSVRQVGNKVYAAWRYYYAITQREDLKRSNDAAHISNEVQGSAIAQSSSYISHGETIFKWMKQNHHKIDTAYVSSVKDIAKQLSNGSGDSFSSSIADSLGDACDRAANTIDNILGGIGLARQGTLAGRLKFVTSLGTNYRKHVILKSGVVYSYVREPMLYTMTPPKVKGKPAYDCSSIVTMATWMAFSLNIGSPDGTAGSTSSISRMLDESKSDVTKGSGNIPATIKGFLPKFRPGDIIIFGAGSSTLNSDFSNGHAVMFVEENSFLDVSGAMDAPGRLLTADEFVNNNSHWGSVSIYRPLDKKMPHDADGYGETEIMGHKRDPKALDLWKRNRKW